MLAASRALESTIAGSQTINTVEKAVLATRDVGMHLYGHPLGIWCNPPRSGHCRGEMEIRCHCVDEHGAVAVGALATLGDMAMQTSSLPAYPGKRLVTMLLRLRWYGVATGKDVQIFADACDAGAQVGTSHATLRDDQGRAIGDLCGTLVPVPPPEGWNPLPCELGLSRPVYPKIIDEAEFLADAATLLKSLGSLSERNSIRFSDLIKLGAPEGDGQRRLRWLPGVHLFNRANVIHGGTVFGALASGLAASADSMLLQHTVQFIRPACGELLIETDVLYQGRRFMSIVSKMLDGGSRSVALGWSQFALTDKCGNGVAKDLVQSHGAARRPAVGPLLKLQDQNLEVLQWT